MRFDLLHRTSVQHQPHRPASLFEHLFHLLSHRIPAIDLIDKSITLPVNDQPTHASQSLSSEELGFRVGIGWVDEAGRMDLDLIEVTEACGVRER